MLSIILGFLVVAAVGKAVTDCIEQGVRQANQDPEQQRVEKARAAAEAYQKSATKKAVDKFIDGRRLQRQRDALATPCRQDK